MSFTLSPFMQKSVHASRVYVFLLLLLRHRAFSIPSASRFIQSNSQHIKCILYLSLLKPPTGAFSFLFPFFLHTTDLSLTPPLSPSSLANHNAFLRFWWRLVSPGVRVGPPLARSCTFQIEVVIKCYFFEPFLPLSRIKFIVKINAPADDGSWKLRGRRASDRIRSKPWRARRVCGLEIAMHEIELMEGRFKIGRAHV